MKIVSVEIEECELCCVDSRHFSHFPSLEILRVRHSQLSQVVCRARHVRHKNLAQGFSKLRALDLSHNALEHIPRKIESLHLLQSINISNNQLRKIEVAFSSFPLLRSLDLSNNFLDDSLDKGILESLPSSIHVLDISGEHTFLKSFI